MASPNQSQSSKKALNINNLRNSATNENTSLKDDRDRKAYVGQYTIVASYPFEIGETVWIVKAEYRAPLGEFRISRAHANDMFELVKISDNSVHPELVEGKYLRRDPYGVES